VSGVPILTPIRALRLHSGAPRPVECFYTHPLLAA
jgi:hypothetical protein